MISWMQKHNKYLVVTIWIATIAFIGAGFVGWGSYQYGSKSGAIAKVGDIEITKARFDIAYNDIYQRLNQQLQGKLDDQKAKEMGLAQQAFSSMTAQALLLNQAGEFGIIVSDDEIAQKLAQIPAFQKDGAFSKAIYDEFLNNRHMKANLFEEVIRDEMVIEKLLSLLNNKSLPFEQEILAAALNISDKIAYKVLTANDINLTATEANLKEYWEAHKESFKTPQQYQLDILWTKSDDANVTEDEIKTYYAQNSFNFIDTNGTQLTLDQAKERVTTELQMQKSKKEAQKAYIGFKKGEISKSETVTLPLNDPLFDAQTWSELTAKNPNDILKPKAISNRYATIKLAQKIESAPMSFEKALELVKAEYEKNAKLNALNSLAETTLKNIDTTQTTVSDFISLDTIDTLKPLNHEESLQFVQKLFTSQKEKGIISVGNNVIVVYKVIEQKMTKNGKMENNEMIEQSADQIKTRVFQENLLKALGEKYTIQKFVEGI